MGAIKFQNTFSIMIDGVQLRQNSVLGSGYSGEVKQVEDEQGEVYALKISNDKTIRLCFGDSSSNCRPAMVLPEAAEFDRLNRLYRSGMPVPKPYALQIYTNAAGVGNTAVLMELVEGKTLRDWLSSQVGGKHDKLSGRSVHPAVCHSEAITRIDVAISIVKSLQKLRKIAFFADFKPRNIMIRDQKHLSDLQFIAYLVDIGGIVLYQDLSTNTYFERKESDSEASSLLYLHPLKDRYLIETTCSYLSPELAFLISEYDFWRGRLNSHYFNTTTEVTVDKRDAIEASNAFQEFIAKNGRIAKNSNVDPKLLRTYLRARKTFKTNGVLRDAESLVGDREGSTLPHSTEPDAFFMPNQTDLICISEKSSVFTMGLMIAELFGGKRTGLTSLSRLKVVNEVFYNEIHNAEFRMAMEWEEPNPTLLGHLNASKGVSRSSVSKTVDVKSYTNMSSSATTSAESLGSNNTDFIWPASSDNGNFIPHGSFFDLFRTYSYPNDGILKTGLDTTQDYADPQGERISSSVCQVLDSCLRGDPVNRPTLSELLVMLQNLKNLVRVR